ncbi:MAG TPA: hypothetical protein VFX28_00195 [Methylomirabilota bacterium]|nr:hypothetical protein [Methylomirabilota bacterium]
MARWSGRVRAGLAVLGMGLIAAAPAAAQIERYPLDNPADVKAGTFFLEFSGLVVPNPSWEAEEARAMGGAEAQAEIMTAATAMSTDTLGLELMRGLDAIRSAALNIRTLRSLFKEDDVFHAQVAGAQQVVTMPDGTQRQLPLVTAWRLQRGMARAAARVLAGRPGAAQLAGSYTAQVEGADCPLAAGPVSVVQQGRAVEVVRNGRLLFGGVVGESERVSLANEQRFVSLVRAGEGARIEAPDRPAEVYLGPLGRTLALAGSKFKLCTVSLAPAP